MIMSLAKGNANLLLPHTEWVWVLGLGRERESRISESSSSAFVKPTQGAPWHGQEPTSSRRKKRKPRRGSRDMVASVGGDGWVVCRRLRHGRSSKVSTPVRVAGSSASSSGLRPWKGPLPLPPPPATLGDVVDQALEASAVRRSLRLGSFQATDRGPVPSPEISHRIFPSNSITVDLVQCRPMSFTRDMPFPSESRPSNSIIINRIAGLRSLSQRLFCRTRHNIRPQILAQPDLLAPPSPYSVAPKRSFAQVLMAGVGEAAIEGGRPSVWRLADRRGQAGPNGGRDRFQTVDRRALRGRGPDLIVVAAHGVAVVDALVGARFWNLIEESSETCLNRAGESCHPMLLMKMLKREQQTQ